MVRHAAELLLRVSVQEQLLTMLVESPACRGLLHALAPTARCLERSNTDVDAAVMAFEFGSMLAEWRQADHLLLAVSGGAFPRQARWQARKMLLSARALQRTLRDVVVLRAFLAADGHDARFLAAAEGAFGIERTQRAALAAWLMNRCEALIFGPCRDYARSLARLAAVSREVQGVMAQVKQEGMAGSHWTLMRKLLEMLALPTCPSPPAPRAMAVPSNSLMAVVAADSQSGEAPGAPAAVAAPRGGDGTAPAAAPATPPLQTPLAGAAEDLSVAAWASWPGQPLGWAGNWPVLRHHGTTVTSAGGSRTAATETRGV